MEAVLQTLPVARKELVRNTGRKCLKKLTMRGEAEKKHFQRKSGESLKNTVYGDEGP